MNIKKIVNNMQKFQKEFHDQFKDSETFWKHFYKKLDKEIYTEFQNIIRGENFENIIDEKEIVGLLKQVFKNIDEFDIVEVEIKEKTT